MPFIAVNTTVKLQPEQKDSIARELGRIIPLIPGKTEPVLMVDVSDDHVMYFSGAKMERCAFVDVRCYKNAPFEGNKAFTEAVFKLLKDIVGLGEGEVYVSISELPIWGTKGSLK
jgi:phenylpyruvate tautomerase PptA (4-oxalocrotonate tautomerase family)